MTQCTHESCGREQRIWLPDVTSLKTDVLLHPWCLHCGQIQNISDDQGKKIGYWINVLSQLTHQLHITQVLKRLILKALSEHDGFLDLYSVTFSAQKEVFTSLITTFTQYSKNTISSLLD